MKKLVATAPRVAALVEYEDRAILANEVKIRVRFGAPKHGTEVVDFRAASPFIDEDFNGEWQMFTPRPADAPRGIEFGKFQLGNMVVGDIIECGSDVTDYAVGDSVCGYGPLSETVIINAVNNYKLRKMPQGSSWKNAVCYDPAQFAMSGVRDANVRVGDFVVVVGLGAIGQIAIQLAKRAGASVVIAVDLKTIETHLFDITKFLQNIFRKERLILCAYFHFFHSFELKRNAHFDALFRMLVDILHVAFRAIGKGHHRVD